MNTDKLIPQRPQMPTPSRELFQSTQYVACITRAGLIVQSHRLGRGKLLPVSHPQYADYVDALGTALDQAEGNALCRALM